MTVQMGDRGSSIFAFIEPDGPLDAVVLFKRTGVLVAGWTRDPIPQDVLTVMAATMMGSVQTLLEALGDSSPTHVALETADRRLLAVKFGTQDALLLVAPKSVSEGVLKAFARKLMKKEADRLSRVRPSRHPVVLRE